MSTAIQRRRGTTAQHAAFTGLTGETTVDTDKNVVVVHNGATAGGFPLLRENGSQNLVTTGTVTGASLSPTSSTVPTNGIYLPAANSVAISTGGSGRLFVSSAGRVGVGAVSTDFSLTVSNTSSDSNIGIAASNTANSEIFFGDTDSLYSGRIRYGHTSDSLQFWTNASERLRITSAGLVGVGTSSPSSLLSVHEATASTANYINITNAATGASSLSNGILLGVNTSGAGLCWQNENLDFLFGTNNTERLRITSAGLVGIGTSSPGSLLHLEGSAPTISLKHTATGTQGTLRWVDSAGTVKSQISSYFNVADAGNIEFCTNGTGTDMVLDSSGRLGIGTTSPSSPLHIVGSSSADFLRGGIRINDTNHSSDYFLGGLASGSFQIATAPAGLTRLVIDSSGRLLVGTSTSSASAALVVQGNPAGATEAGQLYLQCDQTNPVVNTDLAYIRFADGNGSLFAHILGQVDAASGSNDYPGRLVFSTTPDTQSVPVERMKLDSSGKLRIANAGNYSHALNLGGGTFPSIWREGAHGSGIHFTENAGIPANENGTVSDNTESWGIASHRWSVIFAATGTINTSDANEKQDIQNLSDAELAVAKELRNLFRTFRWKHAVAEKGDNARIHVGVIAQDVQQLFAEHGLDVTKYGLWCSDTWYEVDGIGVASDGTPYTADSEGAIPKTRLGIRYEELLAFVLAAL